MKSVWVIEQGSYSDYHVVGVFSSKETAEAALQFLSPDWDAPTVAEWPLDPWANEINSGRFPYTVLMHANGNTIKVTRSSIAYFECGVRLLLDRLLRKGGEDTGNCVPFRRGQGDAISVSCFAKDEEHAVKIANEKRIQLLANDGIRQSA